jgi:hypothetical protein
MWFIVYLALCIIAAVIAGNKGRSAFGFFVLAVLLSPLIGIIAALIARPDIKGQEKKQLATGDMKKCPYCAETIKAEATVCRYCQKEQPPESVPAPQPKPTYQTNKFGVKLNDTSKYDDIAKRHGYSHGTETSQTPKP